MDLEVDGKHVFAATGGKPYNPSLPTVVFIHGTGMDHTIWNLQTRYFAWHGRSVLAVDLPGHGQSEGPALKTVEDMADWIGRMLDAAGAGPASLIGHSMGAGVAIEAASRLGDRISAIALCGTAARMPVNDTLLNAGHTGDPMAINMITEWGFDRRAQTGGAEMPGLWMTGAGVRLLERGDKGLIGTDLQASNDYAGAVAAAGNLTCKVLIVAGELDKMTPVKGLKPLTEVLPNYEIAVIPNCGHMMMVEYPGETLDALKSVL